jgi:hypothetical protein
MGKLVDYNCKRCGETNPENFYTSNGAKSKCKKCHTMETHHRQRMMKPKAVDYLGGKCEDCGLIQNNNSWLFDFHHKDPSIKEWDWGSRRTSNWEKMKVEIDKCVLLCSNCHRTRHQMEWLETLPSNHPMFD